MNNALFSILSVLVLFYILIPIDQISATSKYDITPNDKYVNIIIFDVTGSMEGRGDGGGVDIFDQVKDVAVRIVYGFSNDTYLVIIPFGRGVQEENIFEKHIRSDSDKQEAIRFIQGLSANEPATWLTYSLRFGKNYLWDLKERIDDFDTREQELLLLTDGRGNGPEDVDEFGNFDIQNLIDEFRLIKSDFPHLYARYFAVGNVLPDSERQVLHDLGIDVTVWPDVRERPDEALPIVEGEQRRIVIFDTSPEFTLQFRADDERAWEQTVSIEIVSEKAREIGSGFSITPIEFDLSSEQSFKVSVINRDALDAWLSDNNEQEITGNVRLQSQGFHFQPAPTLPFTYRIERLNISVQFDEQQIRNSGRVRLLIDNPSDQPFEAELALTSATGGLDAYNFKIDPQRIRIQGRERVRLSIEPEDAEFLSSQRKGLSETIEGELMFSITPITPNVSLNQTDFLVQARVTPDRSGLYFLIGLIALLIALLISLIWYFFYLKQQIFSEYEVSIRGSDKERLDQSAGFFTTNLIIGKDIFGEEIGENVVKVSVGPGILIGKKPTLTWYNPDKIEPKEIVETKELIPPVDFQYGEKVPLKKILITRTEI